MENNGIWVNRELKSRYPMYMAGIRKEERLVLLICIYQASYEQMSLYYENLVKIYADLWKLPFCGHSVIRRFIPGTACKRYDFP